MRQKSVSLCQEGGFSVPAARSYTLFSLSQFFLICITMLTAEPPVPFPGRRRRKRAGGRIVFLPPALFLFLLWKRPAPARAFFIWGGPPLKKQAIKTKRGRHGPFIGGGIRQPRGNSSLLPAGGPLGQVLRGRTMAAGLARPPYQARHRALFHQRT